MIEISELTAALATGRTVLFFGAGASIESGAPTGAQLAVHLCAELAGGEPISSDLAEVCSILENRLGRPAVISTVRAKLKDLSPTGGISVLPSFSWDSIYTTNFDRLIESAYRKAKSPITPVRSNYDYGRAETSEGIPLFKLHGCVSQDIVDGHKGRMVLTERDYEEYLGFREVIFKRLELDLVSKNVLVVGHSLRDQHIRRSIKEASRITQRKGGVGRIFVLIFERDNDRALLVEQQGVSVCFGGLEEFLHESTKLCPETPEQSSLPLGDSNFLSARLELTTLDVSHARYLTPTPTRLFHGSPATYADIEGGLTFVRSVENELRRSILASERLFFVIAGVAGVGKTSCARRLLHSLGEEGLYAWEHKHDFPFKSGEWLTMNNRLGDEGKRGVLFIDEAHVFMRQVNKLANGLSRSHQPALTVVITVNHSQWVGRIKSPALFSQGKHIHLSRLTEAEIDDLTYLIDREPRIGTLVDQGFRNLSPIARRKRLVGRCEADMFV